MPCHATPHTWGQSYSVRTVCGVAGAAMTLTLAFCSGFGYGSPRRVTLLAHLFNNVFHSIKSNAVNEWMELCVTRNTLLADGLHTTSVRDGEGEGEGGCYIFGEQKQMIFMIKTICKSLSPYGLWFRKLDLFRPNSIGHKFGGF